MSPLMIGLVQAAGSIAVFLVVLPAGALADMVDQRKLLLFTQSWMVLAAVALGTLTLAGKITPTMAARVDLPHGLWRRLLNDPAWQATTPEVVSRQHFASAGVAAWNSAGFMLSMTSLLLASDAVSVSKPPSLSLSTSWLFTRNRSTLGRLWTDWISLDGGQGGNPVLIQRHWRRGGRAASQRNHHHAGSPGIRRRQGCPWQRRAVVDHGQHHDPARAVELERHDLADLNTIEVDAAAGVQPSAEPANTMRSGPCWRMAWTFR